MPSDDPRSAARTVAMINSDGKSAPVLPDPEGLTTRLYDLRLRVFARTPYEHLFTELGTIEAAERALSDGCDAIYVDTFGDYGVARIRAMTNVPVIGAGEASIAAAGADGQRYSIVTVWPPSMGYLYLERIAACAGGEGCVGVHHLSDEIELELVGTDLGVRSRMAAGDDGAISQLEALCMQVIEQDRPDAILLGCTCMAPASAQLAARSSVPILEPSRIGLAAAFASSGGNRDLASAPPARSMLAGPVVDAYLATRGLEELAVGGCEVCIVPKV